MTESNKPFPRKQVQFVKKNLKKKNPKFIFIFPVK